VHFAAPPPLGLILPVFQISYLNNLAEPTTSFFNRVQTFPSSFLSRNTSRSSIQNSDSTGPNLCLCYFKLLSNRSGLCSPCLNRFNAKRKSILPSRLLLLSVPPPTFFLPNSATVATIITVRQCQLVPRDHCTPIFLHFTLSLDLSICLRCTGSSLILYRKITRSSSAHGS